MLKEKQNIQTCLLKSPLLRHSYGITRNRRIMQAGLNILFLPIIVITLSPYSQLPVSPSPLHL